MKMPREALRVIAPAPLSIETKVHDDSGSLAQALARSVAADLRVAIAERGVAKLALSGGSTPRPFLQALAREQLD